MEDSIRDSSDEGERPYRTLADISDDPRGELLLGMFERDGPNPLGVRTLAEISADAPPPMMIGRLDPEGQTILYGAGGSGKGTLAASWIVKLVREGRRVLIVDYENHPTEWARRVEGLGGTEARGTVWHVAPVTATWSERGGAIWHHAKELQALAEDVGADVIVVDSVVIACGGADPMKPETAAMYAKALALIERPALSLAHVTKAEEFRYPFGSAFWHNLARTTWSLQTLGQRALLTHRKRNNYANLGSFIVTTMWLHDLPHDVSEQPRSLVLADRIGDVLGDQPLTLSEIVNRLDADFDEGDPSKPNSVGKALSRGTRTGRFSVEGSGATARYRRNRE